MGIYKHRGLWMYDFWKNQIRHREGGFQTKIEAQLAEAQARKNLDKINLGFIKLCESRLNDLKFRRTPKYLKENHKLIKKLIKLWAKKKMVERKDVEAYLHSVITEGETAVKKKNKSSFSNAVVNKELRFIKALFNHGIERDMIHYNPAEKIKPFPLQKKRKYIPSKEDLDKVIKVAKPIDRLYLLLVKNTLARISEIDRLRWEDIYDDYLILKTRKARNSDIKERRIPFNKELTEALKQIPKNGEYLFINPKTDTRYVYRKRLMKRLCKEAGVKFFNFHSIRHYGASQLAGKGAGLTDIQYLLGHEKATTTDIYLQELGVNVKKTVLLLED